MHNGELQKINYFEITVSIEFIHTCNVPSKVIRA